jgi:stalled ribosome rescue protein Dom34
VLLVHVVDEAVGLLQRVARADEHAGGAAGIEEVLDALNQARVETLLIAENFRAGGRVDFQAGLLLPETAETGEPVADIVEPAIEKAIEQSATPMVVRHHTDLEPLGGIGAVLRF